MNTKSIIKQIEKRMKAVAAERDKLDDMIGTLEHLKDNCDSAYEDLVCARDHLSELV